MQARGHGAQDEDYAALQLPLRQHGPEQTLHHGGEEQSVDQTEKRAGDFLEWHGHLRVEAEDGNQQQERHLHGHGDTSAVVHPITKQEQPRGHHDVEHGVAGEERRAGDKGQGGPGEDEGEDNHITERAAVAGAFRTQRVHRGENKRAEHHEIAAGRGEPIDQHQRNDGGQRSAQSVADPHAIGPRRGEGQVGRAVRFLRSFRGQPGDLAQSVLQFAQGQKVSRQVAGDLRCDALGGRIAAQRGHGFIDALVQLAGVAVPGFIRRAAFLQDGPSVAEVVCEIIDQAGDPVAVGLGGGRHGCERAQKIRGTHHVADNLREGRNVAAEEAAFAGAEAQESAHLGRPGREIVQRFGQTGVVAAKDGAGLTGGVRQFAEAQAELGDKIAVGVAREDEALHDNAGDHAEQHFLDAGQGEGPRHVGPRLAARGDDDVGQSG